MDILFLLKCSYSSFHIWLGKQGCFVTNGPCGHNKCMKWKAKWASYRTKGWEGLFVLVIGICMILYLDRLNTMRKLFCALGLPTSPANRKLIKCHQREMRVKWRRKSRIFTLIWLTPGGLQSFMNALICTVLCAPPHSTPQPHPLSYWQTVALTHLL